MELHQLRPLVLCSLKVSLDVRFNAVDVLLGICGYCRLLILERLFVSRSFL